MPTQASQESMWDHTLQIDPREVVAVEHPMVVKNVEKGIRTFGLGQPFDRILDEKDPQGCIPLYTRPNDPLCTPLLSYNSFTRNVLLKITVPKRTGRKRRRGTDDPFAEDILHRSTAVHQIIDPNKLGIAATGMDESRATPEASSILSQSQQDNPNKILRTLQDNPDNYKVEAVAHIAHTHRFRGPANYQHSTSNTSFMPKVRDLVISGEVDKLREFDFDWQSGWKNNVDFIPPPLYTAEALPYNWTGLHNEAKILRSGYNTSTRGHQIKYITFDAATVPNEPASNIPPPIDPEIINTIAKIERAFDVRPLWTRRSLLSYLRFALPKYYFDIALQYVCYQFRSGPFRETIVKFGVDPRTDKNFRPYQTVIFADRKIQGRWADPRSNTHANADPIIAEIIKNAPLREPFDGRATGDGFYSNGTLAKIRTIMKAKMVAFSQGRDYSDEDFARTLTFPDVFEDNIRNSRQISFLVPDIAPTEQEVELDIQIRTDGLGKAVDDLGSEARRRRFRKAERRTGKKSAAVPHKATAYVPPKARRKNNRDEHNEVRGESSEKTARPGGHEPTGQEAFLKYLDDQEREERQLGEDGGYEDYDEDDWMSGDYDTAMKGAVNTSHTSSAPKSSNNDPDLHTKGSVDTRTIAEVPQNRPVLEKQNGSTNLKNNPRDTDQGVELPSRKGDREPFEDGVATDDSEATEVLDFRSLPPSKP